jgi:ketosteroid isomerase-like protein
MQHSTEAEAGLRALYAAFDAKDQVAFADRVLDHADAFVIGTQRWSGSRAQWLANFDELVESGADIRLEESAIQAWSDGDWALAVDRPAFVLPGGAGRLPTRLSAMLVRREGRWRVAHAHFSVAVPDEVALEHAAGWLEELGEE